jgi:hypothetical protein
VAAEVHVSDRSGEGGGGGRGGARGNIVRHAGIESFPGGLVSVCPASCCCCVCVHVATLVCVCMRHGSGSDQHRMLQR